MPTLLESGSWPSCRWWLLTPSLQNEQLAASSLSMGGPPPWARVVVQTTWFFLHSRCCHAPYVDVFWIPAIKRSCRVLLESSPSSESGARAPFFRGEISSKVWRDSPMTW